MASSLGLLTELYKRILVAKAACAEAFTQLERDTLALIVESRDQERRGWTQTAVVGCVSPPNLEAAPDVAEVEGDDFADRVQPDTAYTRPADAHDSSAAIPPAMIERADRGGE